MADVYEGWVEALRGFGEEVFTFNLDRRLQFYDAVLINDDGLTDAEGRPAVRKALTRAAAIDLAAHEILKPAMLCWPDVILLISAFWYPPFLLDVLRGRGMKVVLLHTESPYLPGHRAARAGRPRRRQLA